MHRLLRQTIFAVAATSIASVAAAKSPAEWQALTTPVQITLEQAVQAAQTATSGKVVEIELEEGHRGAPAGYEAKVLTADGQRSEVWIDGTSGQAHVEKKEKKAKRKDSERAQAAKIDILQAVQAATAHTPGKAVAAELDSHHGTVSYEVDVLQADYSVMELQLDASDGKVLRSKHDR